MNDHVVVGKNNIPVIRTYENGDVVLRSHTYAVEGRGRSILAAKLNFYQGVVSWQRNQEANA